MGFDCTQDKALHDCSPTTPWRLFGWEVPHKLLKQVKKLFGEPEGGQVSCCSFCARIGALCTLPQFQQWTDVLQFILRAMNKSGIFAGDL